MKIIFSSSGWKNNKIVRSLAHELPHVGELTAKGTWDIKLLHVGGPSASNYYMSKNIPPLCCSHYTHVHICYYSYVYPK